MCVHFQQAASTVCIISKLHQLYALSASCINCTHYQQAAIRILRASLLGKVLELRIKVLGEEHPDVIYCKKDLIRTLAGQGKHEEAEAIKRQGNGMSAEQLDTSEADAFFLSIIQKNKADNMKQQAAKRKPAPAKPAPAPVPTRRAPVAPPARPSARSPASKPASSIPSQKPSSTVPGQKSTSITGQKSTSATGQKSAPDAGQKSTSTPINAGLRANASER
ncbi:hypothetical protein DUNSADRAFT_11121 [Dunaliella salina]|uniref:Uncharacterized protein n=1 Tax=Dunaliella salina TaxID=3046 RepID=A0ABQ7H4L7_DUNSA|nr:hypothetical protein DUNSADRAFT_11121 [Dunaliella salina]|eukprot:KAF5841806.1 hypothetical protein DUNSADRAFT_11121 [Dunaliella salina]